MRLGTGGPNVEGGLTNPLVIQLNVNVEQCVLEGGDPCLNSGTANLYAVGPSNFVVKRNVMIHSWNSGGGIAMGKAPFSAINNLMIFPDISAGIYELANDALVDRDRPGGAIGEGFGRPGDASQTLNRPIRVIGNTIIDYKTYTAGSEDEISAPSAANVATFTGAKVFRDNIIHAPNRSIPLTPLGASPAVVQAVECYTTRARVDLDRDGVHTNFTTTNTGKNIIAPGGAVNLLRPVTGATVIGAATGPAGRIDLLGAVRPADAATGAIEPARDQRQDGADGWPLGQMG